MADQYEGEEYEDDENELGIDPLDVELDEVIGEGTTATVYMGRWEDKNVAIKEIRAWRDMVDQSTVKAVERELTTLSQAFHPNILQFYGLIKDSEPLRLVFEYCAGGSLFELLHNCWHIELTWHQRLKMLLDSANAMDYLHSFDPAIIHRDFKSLNLMLLEPVTGPDSDAHIKLGDFGFARAKEREMTQGVGTKHWMAPEVLKTTRYTEKADIFSYAMVVFEVICRHVPFERIQPIVVAQLISSGERPKATDHVDEEEIPEGLLDLMASCWSQDPLSRPSAKAIADDLTSIIARNR